MKKIIQDIYTELTSDILPFWTERMTDPHGGFYGRMDGKGRIQPDACKGAVLNARILWTFASAYRVLGKDEYLDTARSASDYIKAHFIDHEMGGVFWSLDADGKPLDTRKQYYAIAFTIYGFAELFRACGDKEALELATRLYRDIEKHSLDREKGGYVEASSRGWQPLEDMRLSEKDQNDAKTMNTHLHILEAYTALYRVWKDDSLKASLKGMVRIFLDRIICEDGHLGLFFDEDWGPRSTIVSYGHDIEASWLLCEAAAVLEDQALMDEVRMISIRIAESAMEGFTPEGGMINEYDPASGRRSFQRDWWVQAETVVGCIHQYQNTGEDIWMKRALQEWEFIRKNIICPDGEWYWSAVQSADGFKPDDLNDRAGFWKCPYHDSRMCLEIIERFPTILSKFEGFQD